MSTAHLIRDDRWRNVPEPLYSAIEADLRTRQYAEPHDDAHITKISASYSDYGIHATVEVTVTVYPSQEELRNFYGSGWEGVIAAPGPRDVRHTLEIDL